jgi:hypothetical protein
MVDDQDEQYATHRADGRIEGTDIVFHLGATPFVPQ